MGAFEGCLELDTSRVTWNTATTSSFVPVKPYFDSMSNGFHHTNIAPLKFEEQPQSFDFDPETFQWGDTELDHTMYVDQNSADQAAQVIPYQHYHYPTASAPHCHSQDHIYHHDQQQVQSRPTSAPTKQKLKKEVVAKEPKQGNDVYKPRIFQRVMSQNKAREIEQRLQFIRERFDHSEKTIGRFDPLGRKALLAKYRAKRRQMWKRQLEYEKNQIRKKISEMRPRFKGRFIKTEKPVRFPSPASSPSD